LVVAWFGVTGAIRSHVDGLIEHSVGKALPGFQLADRSGKVWSAADLGGQRAVLHFFRSRCGNCDAEAPAIRELEQRLPADVVLLHVMTDAVLDFPAELTAETLAHKQFTRPVLMADAAFVDAFHHVQWSNVTPITYIVDAVGVVRFGLRGKQTTASIEAALAAVK
jgi:peroxiredoxin